MARTKATAGKGKSSASKSKSESQAPSKRVRIVEPSEETVAPISQKSSAGQPKSILKEKGKGLLITSSQSVPSQHEATNSETESEGTTPETTAATSSRARPQAKGKGKKKDIDLLKAPEGFNTSSVIVFNSSKYEEKLKNRALCPAVSVDLKEVDRMGYKISEFLSHYEPLIQIKDFFCPVVVRIFYNNMHSNSVTNEDGEIISYSMVTKMRGTEILITSEILNGFLGTNDFVKTLSTLTNEEIFGLLRPGEPVPKTLAFDPSAMPPLQRIIHYIYSRCIVNKSGNYTHFASSDYVNMARIMKKEKRNIGELVFDEMWRFVHSGSKRMTVPYPSLVSFILKNLKIWYILDKVIEPTLFGEIHLRRMNISVENPQVQPSKRKRRTTSVASQGQDDAQSSAPPQSPSAPSFAQASIQHFMEVEFEKMSKTLIDNFSNHFKTYMDTLLLGANDHFTGKNFDYNLAALGNHFIKFKAVVFEKIDDLKSTVAGLDQRVASIEQYIRESTGSTSAPPPPPPPPAPSSEDPSPEEVLAMINFSSSFLQPDPQPTLQPSSPPPSDDPVPPLDPQPLNVAPLSEPSSPSPEIPQDPQPEVPPSPSH